MKQMLTDSHQVGKFLLYIDPGRTYIEEYGMVSPAPSPQQSPNFDDISIVPNPNYVNVLVFFSMKGYLATPDVNFTHSKRAQNIV